MGRPSAAYGRSPYAPSTARPTRRRQPTRTMQLSATAVANSRGCTVHGAGTLARQCAGTTPVLRRRPHTVRHCRRTPTGTPQATPIYSLPPANTNTY
eukprot:GDKH01028298.1.p1 GENE.GDKH01028298.1~~GDKH01028298.1.p1  ORF type:complete len:97 (+),score=6.34 GDKH01028298.1:186-476(+)